MPSSFSRWWLCCIPQCWCGGCSWRDGTAEEMVAVQKQWQWQRQRQCEIKTKWKKFSYSPIDLHNSAIKMLLLEVSPAEPTSQYKVFQLKQCNLFYMFCFWFFLFHPFLSLHFEKSEKEMLATCWSIPNCFRSAITFTVRWIFMTVLKWNWIEFNRCTFLTLYFIICYNWNLN